VSLPPEEKRASLAPRARAWLTRIQTGGASPLRGVWHSLTLPQAHPWVFFALSLIVYALTRLVALDQFPIYFFTDEAIHPVHAADLLQRGLRDGQGNLFPVYFQNGQYWNLSLSVYVHAVSVFLFGKSIWVTRATAALISVFGAAAVGLILKSIFKVRIWWAGVLILAVTPAWFLHSRTAFETGLMVSFYAWFLLCYLLYRYRSPRYLFPALVFGAATFYSYANGQAVMAITGLFCLLSDLRYHLRNWMYGAWGIQLLAWLVAPYLLFRRYHPEAFASHLQILSSYWLEPIPLREKIVTFLSTYAYGLSPQYWFLPNTQDLVRHQMNDYGHLGLWALPFFFLGVGICLSQIRSAAHRVILIAALAAPFGSALVNIAITRALAFVIPAAIFATLGLDGALERFTARRAQIVTLSVFLVLALLGFAMLGDALINGPTWSRNYGLYGMQWGEKQIFAEVIPEYLRRAPDSKIYVSSTWANGTDVFLRFFGLGESHVQMLNVDFFMAYQRPLDPRAVFIIPPDEYVRASTSTKFKPLRVEQIIPYPDGTPGFHIARLEYVDNVEEIFAAEFANRRQLVVERILLDNQVIPIAHSLFDSGRLTDIFDDNPFTLARGMEANPFILEFEFAQPRAIRSIFGIFGRMNFQLTALVYADDSDVPITYSTTYANLPGEPQIEMPLDRGPARVSKIRLEIQDRDAGEMTHIHIRELKFK
jgi:4-amino-4-deoxy-L-arabinose transferase-like glycosyltransferase